MERFLGKGSLEGIRSVVRNKGQLSKLNKYLELYEEYSILAHEGKSYPDVRLDTTISRLRPYIENLYGREKKLLDRIVRTGKPIDLMDIVLTKRKAENMLGQLQNFITVSNNLGSYSRGDKIIALDSMMSLVHSGYCELPMAFGLSGISYSLAQEASTSILDDLSGKLPKPLKMGKACTGMSDIVGFIPNIEFEPKPGWKPYGPIEDYALAPGQEVPPWWDTKKFGEIPRATWKHIGGNRKRIRKAPPPRLLSKNIKEDN